MTTYSFTMLTTFVTELSTIFPDLIKQMKKILQNGSLASLFNCPSLHTKFAISTLDKSQNNTI